MRTKPLTTNNNPVLAWIFLLIWLAMLGIFTFVYWRDGGSGYAVWILGLFWTVGLAAAWHHVRIPRVRVFRDGGQLLVLETWLTGSRKESASATSLELVEGEDSDGDRYFRLYIQTGSGRRVLVCESPDRSTLESAQRKLLGEE
jgi:hypothetical protein